MSTDLNVAMSSQTISQRVASEVASVASTPAILDSVVKSLVSQEINRRSDALLKVINQAFSLKKELYKVKPDILSYNVDGTVAQAAWSKPKLEEKKKLEEKLDKLDRAIAKAVEKGDYTDVFNAE